MGGTPSTTKGSRPPFPHVAAFQATQNVEEKGNCLSAIFSLIASGKEQKNEFKVYLRDNKKFISNLFDSARAAKNKRLHSLVADIILQLTIEGEEVQADITSVLVKNGMPRWFVAYMEVVAAEIAAKGGEDVEVEPSETGSSSSTIHDPLALLDGSSPALGPKKGSVNFNFEPLTGPVPVISGSVPPTGTTPSTTLTSSTASPLQSRQTDRRKAPHRVPDTDKLAAILVGLSKEAEFCYAFEAAGGCTALNDLFLQPLAASTRAHLVQAMVEISEYPEMPLQLQRQHWTILRTMLSSGSLESAGAAVRYVWRSLHQAVELGLDFDFIESLLTAKCDEFLVGVLLLWAKRLQSSRGNAAQLHKKMPVSELLETLNLLYRSDELLDGFISDGSRPTFAFLVSYCRSCATVANKPADPGTPQPSSRGTTPGVRGILKRRPSTTFTEDAALVRPTEDELALYRESLLFLERLVSRQHLHQQLAIQGMYKPLLSFIYRLQRWQPSENGLDRAAPAAMTFADSIRMLKAVACVVPVNASHLLREADFTDLLRVARSWIAENPQSVARLLDLTRRVVTQSQRDAAAISLAPNYQALLTSLCSLLLELRNLDASQCRAPHTLICQEISIIADRLCAGSGENLGIVTSLVAPTDLLELEEKFGADAVMPIHSLLHPPSSKTTSNAGSRLGSRGGERSVIAVGYIAEQNMAALLIQRAWRGRLARNVYRELLVQRQRERAAVQIQRLWRAKTPETPGKLRRSNSGSSQGSDHGYRKPSTPPRPTSAADPYNALPLSSFTDTSGALGPAPPRFKGKERVETPMTEYSEDESPMMSPERQARPYSEGNPPARVVSWVTGGALAPFPSSRLPITGESDLLQRDDESDAYEGTDATSDIDMLRPRSSGPFIDDDDDEQDAELRYFLERREGSARRHLLDECDATVKSLQIQLEEVQDRYKISGEAMLFFERIAVSFREPVERLLIWLEWRTDWHPILLQSKEARERIDMGLQQRKCRAELYRFSDLLGREWSLRLGIVCQRETELDRLALGSAEDVVRIVTQDGEKEQRTILHRFFQIPVDEVAYRQQIAVEFMREASLILVSRDEGLERTALQSGFQETLRLSWCISSIIAEEYHCREELRKDAMSVRLTARATLQRQLASARRVEEIRNKIIVMFATEEAQRLELQVTELLQRQHATGRYALLLAERQARNRLAVEFTESEYRTKLLANEGVVREIWNMHQTEAIAREGVRKLERVAGRGLGLLSRNLREQSYKWHDETRQRQVILKEESALWSELELLHNEVAERAVIQTTERTLRATTEFLRIADADRTQTEIEAKLSYAVITGSAHREVIEAREHTARRLLMTNQQTKFDQMTLLMQVSIARAATNEEEAAERSELWDLEESHLCDLLLRDLGLPRSVVAMVTTDPLGRRKSKISAKRMRFSRQSLPILVALIYREDTMRMELQDEEASYRDLTLRLERLARQEYSSRRENVHEEQHSCEAISLQHDEICTRFQVEEYEWRRFRELLLPHYVQLLVNDETRDRQGVQQRCQTSFYAIEGMAQCVHEESDWRFSVEAHWRGGAAILHARLAALAKDAHLDVVQFQEARGRSAIERTHVAAVRVLETEFLGMRQMGVELQEHAARASICAQELTELEALDHLAQAQGWGIVKRQLLVIEEQEAMSRNPIKNEASTTVAAVARQLRAELRAALQKEARGSVLRLETTARRMLIDDEYKERSHFQPLHAELVFLAQTDSRNAALLRQEGLEWQIILHRELKYRRVAHVVDNSKYGKPIPELRLNLYLPPPPPPPPRLNLAGAPPASDENRAVPEAFPSPAMPQITEPSPDEKPLPESPAVSSGPATARSGDLRPPSAVRGPISHSSRPTTAAHWMSRDSQGAVVGPRPRTPAVDTTGSSCSRPPTSSGPRPARPPSAMPCAGPQKPDSSAPSRPTTAALPPLASGRKTSASRPTTAALRRTRSAARVSAPESPMTPSHGPRAVSPTVWRSQAGSGPQRSVTPARGSRPKTPGELTSPLDFRPASAVLSPVKAPPTTPISRSRTPLHPSFASVVARPLSPLSPLDAGSWQPKDVAKAQADLPRDMGTVQVPIRAQTAAKLLGNANAALPPPAPPPAAAQGPKRERLGPQRRTRSRSRSQGRSSPQRIHESAVSWLTSDADWQSLTPLRQEADEEEERPKSTPHVTPPAARPSSLRRPGSQQRSAGSRRALVSLGSPLGPESPLSGMDGSRPMSAMSTLSDDTETATENTFKIVEDSIPATPQFESEATEIFPEVPMPSFQPSETTSDSDQKPVFEAPSEPVATSFDVLEPGEVHVQFEPEELPWPVETVPVPVLLQLTEREAWPLVAAEQSRRERLLSLESSVWCTATSVSNHVTTWAPMLLGFFSDIAEFLLDEHLLRSRLLAKYNTALWSLHHLRSQDLRRIRCDRSAVAIQRVFRGFSDRRRLEVTAHAALRIQSVVRRWLVVRRITRRIVAAFAIQRAYRTHLAARQRAARLPTVPHVHRTPVKHIKSTRESPTRRRAETSLGFASPTAAKRQVSSAPPQSPTNLSLPPIRPTVAFDTPPPVAASPYGMVVYVPTMVLPYAALQMDWQHPMDTRAATSHELHQHNLHAQRSPYRISDPPKVHRSPIPAAAPLLPEIRRAGGTVLH
eukprot:TRINITY_DN3693_c0_g1_i5.p1 TRINITY_DN3693_c0_g1~~TRINITY_DN3693_c0_g1_i5.p1  ORF type:complete len:2655 (-),score=353.12 TRINITY_DN3693_c0_g1_i5:20-7984(-)